MNVMEEKMLEISEKDARELESVIDQATPAWWKWCVKKGGIFRSFAQYFLKVIVIERKD